MTNPIPEREFPNSVESERGVLGCIMLDSSCLDTIIEKLDSSEAFYDLRHRAIFDVMLELHSQGVAIDLILLQQKLSDKLMLEGVGGLVYLSSLPDATPSAANLGHYLDIVAEKHTLRRAITTCTEIASKAYSFDGDVDTLVGELTKDILALGQSSRQESSFWSATQLVPLSIDWAERCLENQGKLSGIPTGFVDYDTLTDGLQDGDLTIIGARPSMGKSAILMNIADYIAVNIGLPVLVFSLEMSAQSVMNRMACSRARVSMTRVRRGQMNAGEFESLGAAFAQLKKAPLHIDESRGLTISKLSAKARRYQQQFGIKVILIDYLQLIKAKADTSEKEIEAVANGLQTLTRELKIPGVAAAQLNRESERGERKPRLLDLRGSGSIEQAGDVVALIHHYEQEDSAEQAHGATKAGLIVAKQRNGEVDEVPLVFLKAFTRFETATNYDPTN